MLTRRIIPCLDVKDGRVVKGVRFEELRDAGDPLEQARAYGRAGADELCFLDISASLESRGTLIGLVERVARELSIPFAVGGGVRTVEDAEALLRAGADKVSMNSAAIADPRLITAVARLTGSQSALLAIDAKRSPGAGRRWEVYSHGGTRATGKDAVAWAREGVDRGAGEILLTSMDRDGTGKGFELELTAAPKADPKQAKPVKLEKALADFSQDTYAVSNAIDGGVDDPSNGWARRPAPTRI